jgi:phosphohistidine phosphatase
MKRLLLLRHAEAVPSAHNDHARALSGRGRTEAAGVGRAIAASGWAPCCAVVSDARRTHETFQTLGLEPTLTLALTPVLYNAAPETIIAALAATAPEVTCQLAVGHNPGIALAARALAVKGGAGELARLASAFPTAGLAVVRFDIQDWATIADTPGELEALLWPDDTAKR